MAINIDKIKARLNQYENTSKSVEFTKLLWKPRDGTSTIRIVPYRPNGNESDQPFLELKFYYGISGKTYLAPCTYGKADPMQEMVEKCFESGEETEKSWAKKYSAKTRIYAPIIVRGEENLGVRYWGFGVLVHKQLLELIGQDGGDITDLANGNDLKITFKKDAKKDASGNFFPETIITPVLKKSPACSPTDKEAMNSIKSQVDINTIFPLKTYDELKDIVDKWLNPEGENPSAEEQEKAAIAADAAPVEKVKSEAATHVPVTAAEVEDEFSRFFAKK
jgi:hypothetical protein